MTNLPDGFMEPPHWEPDMEPVATGWMLTVNMDGHRTENLFTGPDALTQCALFQESTGLMAASPEVDCFEVEVFRALPLPAPPPVDAARAAVQYALCYARARLVEAGIDPTLLDNIPLPGDGATGTAAESQQEEKKDGR